MRVTMLGCGGSEGVPVVGNNWGACDPANPKNRRSRVSAVVQSGGAGLLIDTSPDLRQQLLDTGISRIDAVLWTHNHADHCHGIADLREVCRLKGCSVDVFAAPEHLEDIVRRFAYCFEPLPPGKDIYRPVLTPQPVNGPFHAAGIAVTPIVQDHGYTTSLGFRVGNFAYSTDVVRLDDNALSELENLDLWIVDCVREAPGHPVHATLPTVLAWVERLRPKRTVLTHMNLTMDYETIRAKLPPGIEPGYDGMTFDLPDPA